MTVTVTKLKILYTKTRMKGQGSRELIDEIKKIDNLRYFYKSGSHVLDGFYK